MASAPQSDREGPAILSVKRIDAVINPLIYARRYKTYFQTLKIIAP